MRLLKSFPVLRWKSHALLQKPYKGRGVFIWLEIEYLLLFFSQCPFLRPFVKMTVRERETVEGI